MECLRNKTRVLAESLIFFVFGRYICCDYYRYEIWKNVKILQKSKNFNWIELRTVSRRLLIDLRRLCRSVVSLESSSRTTEKASFISWRVGYRPKSKIFSSTLCFTVTLAFQHSKNC